MWVTFGSLNARFSLFFRRNLAFLWPGELVTMRGWQNSSDSWTSTASPASSPGPRFAGIFGDPRGVVITLRRRRKKRAAACAGKPPRPTTTKRPRRVRDLSCGDKRVYLDFLVRRVQCSRCGAVKRERLDWLADNPLYTKRFAFFVGRRCRETTVQEVAEELHLDWHTVKELDKQYMREQLRRAGCPAPAGHRHRRDRHRQGAPVPHRGQRPGAGPAHLVRRQGPLRGEPGRVLRLARPARNAGKIRLAVMDMWQAFRNSTLKEGNAPQATILYDKFHVLRHLGEAMDKVRKREYARLSGQDRRFIKGQRYTLLSHWENLHRRGPGGR